MTLRSTRGLEDTPYHLTLPYTNLYTPRVNGFQVTWFAYGLFIYSGYPGYVTNTVPYSLEIDYSRSCDSFELLQALIKSLFPARFAGPVPRTLKKQSAARVKLTSATSMYFTQGCWVNVLDKLHDRRVDWWRFTEHSGFVDIGSVLFLHVP